MAITPLSSIYSVSGFQKTAASKLQSAAAALAAGKRLNKASDDIASLAAATSLGTQIGSSRQALNNIAIASSMLQVADGGMEQISATVDRMRQIAVMANSGAISDSTRESLNRELQQLAQSIDLTAGGTSFAGQKLLNGSLNISNELSLETEAATNAQGSLNFTNNLTAGETINLNGRTLTAGTDFAVGGTLQQSLDNLATALNASTDSRTSSASFSRQGDSLQITAKAAGEQGNQFTIDQGASTASFTVSGDQLGASSVFSLTGGANDGVSAGSVTVSGSATNNLVTGQTQQPATSIISFTSVADIQNGDTLQIDDGNGGSVTFTFTTGTPASTTEIQIGSTLEETLQNASRTLNDYTGADDFGIRQLEFSRDGNDLVITAANGTGATDASGNALDITLGTTGGSISNSLLDNAVRSGVDTRGVSNANFTGTIQGFTATYGGSADQLTASITVGDVTYTAQIGDTSPAGDTTVRFSSEDGGYFDVELAGGNGQSVSSQSDANSFANRLNAAFAGLTFSQDSEITNVTGTGSLTGASVSLQTDQSGGQTVDSIRVTAPEYSGDSATIEISINGETYRSDADLGTSIGAGESIKLTSISNPNRVLTFTNGENRIELETSADAKTFESALKQDFGTGNGGSFQVGADTDDTVEVTIDNLSTQELFDGARLSVLSQSDASGTLDAINAASSKLMAQRAKTGSLQSSLDYAGAALESAIQNQEAARSVLTDADFAEESTKLSQARIQQQASIALQAQGNKFSLGLLRLIG